jgi:hypothetical protein
LIFSDKPSKYISAGLGGFLVKMYISTEVWGATFLRTFLIVHLQKREVKVQKKRRAMSSHS